MNRLRMMASALAACAALAATSDARAQLTGRESFDGAATGKPAVQGFVRGVVSSVNFSAGTIALDTTRGQVLLNATPYQMAALRTGETLQAQVARYGRELWLLENSSQIGQRQFSAGVNLTGVVQQIDKASGVIGIATSAGNVTLAAHPAMIEGALPGQYLTATYQTIGGVPWIAGVSSAGHQFGGGGSGIGGGGSNVGSGDSGTRGGLGSDMSGSIANGGDLANGTISGGMGPGMGGGDPSDRGGFASGGVGSTQVGNSGVGQSQLGGSSTAVGNSGVGQSQLEPLRGGAGINDGGSGAGRLGAGSGSSTGGGISFGASGDAPQLASGARMRGSLRDIFNPQPSSPRWQSGAGVASAGAGARARLRGSSDSAANDARGATPGSGASASFGDPRPQRSTPDMCPSSSQWQPTHNQPISDAYSDTEIEGNAENRSFP